MKTKAKAVEGEREREFREALEAITALPTIYKDWSEEYQCLVAGYAEPTGPYWIANDVLAKWARNGR